MFQNQDITGDHNQQAGGDINNHTAIYQNKTPVRPLSIARVLSGISECALNQSPTFSPPDTFGYTIEEKVYYNKLERYREFYAHFLEEYNRVKTQIEAASEVDPGIETRITGYIKRVYVASWQATASADQIIERMLQRIEADLANCDAPQLTGDDILAVNSVIFYVFANCKIFKKPPTHVDTERTQPG